MKRPSRALAAATFAAVVLSGAAQTKAHNVSGTVDLPAAITNFGAVCDGSTDDGPAVQRSVNASNAVLIPRKPRRCVINTTVSVPAGVKIYGPGGMTTDYVGAVGCLYTAAPIDMFKLSAGANSFDGVCIVHDGAAGSAIVDAGKIGSNSITNSTVKGNHPGNTNDIVKFVTSANVVQNNRFTNMRPAGGYTVRFDAGSSKSEIENTFSANLVTGTGLGISYGSGDASARQEGGFVLTNQFLGTGGHNLMIQNALSMKIIGNEFDQASDRNVVIAPNGKLGTTDVIFTANYFSTPNKMQTGVCIDQPSTGFGVAHVLITSNNFDFCGYGGAFNATADGVTVSNNTIGAIGRAAFSFSQSKNVIYVHNRQAGITGSNLIASDGAAGGPFVIDGNIFDPSASIDLTQTAPAKFAIGSTNRNKLEMSGGCAVSAAGAVTCATTNGTGGGTFRFSARADFNAANADTPIGIAIPPGFTRYRVAEVAVTGASRSINRSAAGLFTAAGGAGVAIVPASRMTLTSAADATDHNAQMMNVNNGGTTTYMASALYWRTVTAEGVPATATVSVTVVFYP